MNDKKCVKCHPTPPSQGAFNLSKESDQQRILADILGEGTPATKKAPQSGTADEKKLADELRSLLQEVQSEAKGLYSKGAITAEWFAFEQGKFLLDREYAVRTRIRSLEIQLNGDWGYKWVTTKEKSYRPPSLLVCEGYDTHTYQKKVPTPERIKLQEQYDALVLGLEQKDWDVRKARHDPRSAISFEALNGARPEAEGAGSFLDHLPIIGPIRQALDHLANGRLGEALLSTFLAIGDLYLVKGVVAVTGRLALRSAAAGSNYQYGVHWTRAQFEAGIWAQQRIVPGPASHGMVWVEPAETLRALRTIMRRGGAGTRARGTDVAIIVDIRGLPHRAPGGGGIGLRLPEGLDLRERGITWWWNTGSPGEIRRIIEGIAQGRRTYGP
jgi:hypothetical protein